MPFPPTPTNVWDLTQPPDTQLLNQGALDFRSLKNDVMQRMSLLSGTIANRPTPETANAIWGGIGFGLIYFATDTGKMYQWSGAGPAWVDITSSFFLPGKVASIDLVGATPNIGATNLYTVPAGASGVYRLTYDLLVTATGAGNSSLQFAWNNGVAAQTFNTTAFSNGVLGAEDQNTASQRMFIPAGQSITYALNGTVGTVQFSLRMRLEFLG